MHTIPPPLWISPLLFAGAIGLACRQSPDMATSRSDVLRLLDPKSDTGIELRAVVLRDTVNAGDRTPVEVLYAIVNGPLRRPFDNEAERYRVVVVGPDNQPAKRLAWSSPGVGLGPRADMQLPAGGVLIQREDLRCVRGHAYSAVPLTEIKHHCLAVYALTTPGRYRVIVEYFGGPRPRDAAAR